MKLVAIKNEGLICEEDLFLIGSSTKRDDTSKIGMFGSGWKYALAWLLRNGCGIQIFSGQTEIKIGSVEKYHRDHLVHVITVNGKETSLTTEMGPDWTAWMAIREIVSNAIDEGGFEYELDASLQKEDNTTTVYISANEEIETMFQNFDSYFAFNREGGVILMKTYLSGDRKYSTVYIKSERSPLVVYRKGIRCYNNTEEIETFFDIDIEDIQINESRLAEFYNIKNCIATTFNETLDYNVFKSILKDVSEVACATTLTGSLTGHFKKAIEEGMQFGTKTSGLFESNLGKILLSTDLYNELAKLGLVKSFYDLINVEGAPSGFKYTDEVLDVDIDEIKLFLKENFNIDNLVFHIGDFHLQKYFEIKVGKKDVYFNSLCTRFFENSSTKEICVEILKNANSNFFEAQLAPVTAEV